MTSNDLFERIIAYHERTKHRFERYATGPDFLDWDQQPDPFRTYSDAPQVPLTHEFDFLPDPTIQELDRMHPLKPLSAWDTRELAGLLRFALGLSAWKSFGPDRWSLRCNPSSGNLHPTECYLVLQGITGFQDGVYHYHPYQHALELRCGFEKPAQSNDQPARIWLALSSIAWREAWKYGERAFRYVQLDLGHAVGTLAYSAAIQGYRLQRLPMERRDIARLIGLDRVADSQSVEPEVPDLLLDLAALDDTETVPTPPSRISIPAVNEWHGLPNRLSTQSRHPWPVIDRLEQSLLGAPLPADVQALIPDWPDPPELTAVSAREMILQRRSAQAFNSKATCDAGDFFNLLDQTLPRRDRVPWSSWQIDPRVHLLIFAHKVRELDPGLYLLCRNPSHLESLKTAMDSRFEWSPLPSAPAHLPLYKLLSTEAKRAARALSCHQDIAASSYFSLGMLSYFEPVLHERGPQIYPELFWEAGLIGQVLYLQAEAMNMRGTGIGCFFDDGVHEILGLQDRQFQSLYHFTVGQPKQDDRLQTHPPYQHLES
ncbi:MAG: SagB family peptide dehydrogenase [Candidatus Thiodiazotropha sp.]